MRACNLDQETAGEIDERQTTFVTFTHYATGRRVKIRFRDKREFRIEAGLFVGAAVADRHPLLEQYEHTNTTIFVSSTARDARAVIAQLSLALRSHFQGWRNVDNYCNTGYGLQRLLEEGSGLLYAGPPSGAEIVKTLLERNGIAYTSPSEGQPTGKKFKVLFLGNSFVVAEDFVIEEIEP
jgi:hypothetical protein